MAAFALTFFLAASITATNCEDHLWVRSVGIASNRSTTLTRLCNLEACLKAGNLITAAMNWSANPCEDFSEFACGGFQAAHQLPPGEALFDQFSITSKIIRSRLRQLLEAPNIPNDASSFRYKTRLYYKSCLDVKNVSKSGIRRLWKMVFEIGGLFLKDGDTLPPSWSLTNAMIKYSAFSATTLFQLSIGPDLKNTSENVMQLKQSVLSLGPDSRDFYGEANSSSILVALVDKLVSFAKIILGTSNQVDRDLVLHVISLEQKIAQIQQSAAEIQDTAANYNKVNVTWLQSNLAFLNWTAYLQSLFDPVDVDINESDPVVLYGITHFRNLTILLNNYQLTDDGKRTLQNYLVLKAILAYGSLLGGPFQNATDRFDSTLRGNSSSSPPAINERWQICLDETNSAMGYALGAMYVESYFSPEDKQAALQTVADVVNAFRKRIAISSQKNGGWMTNETRQSALEKLDAIAFDAGYPDQMLNETYMAKRFANLEITDDFASNMIAIFRDGKKYSRAQLWRQPDRAEWGMIPQTVNAYYDTAKNKMFIAAGILTPPFFYPDPEVPYVLSYGAIGFVMGHETTHGFDNIGSHFDKFGNLRNWWDNKSAQLFSNASRCLVDQYDDFELAGLHVRGRQTLSENIADNGGVRTSYQAYKAAITDGSIDDGVGLANVKNLTNDQLFFISNAQVWCAVYSPPYAKVHILGNNHPPAKFRINGPLANSPEFADAFQCPIGSKMNPANKCSVW